MCGRYTARKPKDIFKALRVPVSQLGLFSARYNIAPSQRLPIIRATGERAASIASWGFKAGDKLLINARSETAAKLPTFRDAYLKKRCFVPVDGFYEWKATGSGKQPFLFERRGGQPFAFAGLWRDGEDGEEFVILTTAANELVSPIHERMPCMLTPEDAERWLAEPSANLLRSFPALDMEVHPVSKRVNNMRVDDPTCAEPIELPQIETGLFD